MKQEFINILQKFVAKKGYEILLDPNANTMKSLLADITLNEYKRERHLLLQAIDIKVAIVLYGTQNLELCKSQQIKLLQNEFSITAEAATDVVNLITVLLKNICNENKIIENDIKFKPQNTNHLNVKVSKLLINSKLRKTDEHDFKLCISAGGYHTVSLKSTSVLSTDGRNLYGLKSDSMVIAVGNNKHGQCNIGSWQDIVAISAGIYHTIGLKSNGTVIAVGNNKHGQCNTGSWQDIVAISAGYDHTVGLKSNGTVIAVGDNVHGRDNTGSWQDIVAISAGYDHTVGLKSNGTVIAVGNNEYGRCNTSSHATKLAIIEFLVAIFLFSSTCIFPLFILIRLPNFLLDKIISHSSFGIFLILAFIPGLIFAAAHEMIINKISSKIFCFLLTEKTSNNSAYFERYLKGYYEM